MSTAAPEAILPAAALIPPPLAGAALINSGATSQITLPRTPPTASLRTRHKHAEFARTRIALAVNLDGTRSAVGVFRVISLRLRIAVGSMPLIASAPAFIIAALVTAGMFSLSLSETLHTFIRPVPGHASHAAPIAGASALLAFATAARIEGAFGFPGVPAQLQHLDPRNLSRAAALIWALATCSFLQLVAPGRASPAALPRTPGVRSEG